VVSQLTEEYRCESESLFPLWMRCRELMTQFRYINFYWIQDHKMLRPMKKAIIDEANFPV
jgi:hypothetical protein